MKKTIGLTALVSGLLLMTVPRFVLPACEYEGFSAMHCSATARAELIAGIALFLIGLVTLSIKSLKAAGAGGAAALTILIISVVLPDIFGFCQSSRMPCNYGMVPGIRFISVTAGIVMIIGVIGVIKDYRKKGKV